MNNWIGLGRMVRDPEVRYTQTGKAVAQFTIAINRPYKNAEGNYDADFINCVAWNKSAEFVEKYFTKGRMIIVVGRIQTRTWEGQDGKKNYVTEVVASEVSFGESKKNAEEGGSYSAPRSDYNPAFDTALPDMPNGADDDFVALDTNDDLPF